MCPWKRDLIENADSERVVAELVAQVTVDSAFTDDPDNWMLTQASSAPGGSSPCGNEQSKYLTAFQLIQDHQARSVCCGPCCLKKWYVAFWKCRPMHTVTGITKHEPRNHYRDLSSVADIATLLESFLGARMEQCNVVVEAVKAVFRQTPSEMNMVVQTLSKPVLPMQSDELEADWETRTVPTLPSSSMDYSSYNEYELEPELFILLYYMAHQFMRRNCKWKGAVAAWIMMSEMLQFIEKVPEAPGWVGKRLYSGLCSGRRFTALLNTLNHMVYSLITSHLSGPAFFS